MPGDPDDGGGRPRRSVRAAVLVAVAGALLTALFASLGVWQVERLSWKMDLIERVEARVAAEPVPPPSGPEWASIEAATHEYRHVRLDGRFLNDRETLVQAVTERGPGSWVLTPFEQRSGDVVLINRGFVPAERRDPASRAEGLIEGETTVAGLLRLSEPDGGFLRANDAEGERWFSRDVGAIGRARGLTSLAPYFVDADASAVPGGYPVGGLTVVAFRNNHLVYALTWFALAAMVAGAVVYTLVDMRARRRGQPKGWTIEARP